MGKKLKLCKECNSSGYYFHVRDILKEKPIMCPSCGGRGFLLHEPVSKDDKEHRKAESR